MRTEDGSIVHRCLNGEPEAFGLLVDKYKTGIYAFVYAKIHDFHHAQDVTQEVFLQAYRGLRNLRTWESFVFWLYRIASMQCKMWLRSQSRRPDSESIEDQDPAILEAPSLDAYRESQVSESLREVLDALPEAYREVLLLHYFGGMTSKDIAGAIGISPVAVLKRLSRARSQLKEEMVDMVSKTFKRRRLPITFTFRIVEAVKRVKIQPMTQSRGLPWGLSLTAGIIMAILGFNPRLNLLNPQDFPRGSPLPVEMKVLETGELPVEVLKISKTLAIASRPGDGDGGESRPSDESGEFFLAPQASEVKLIPRDGAAGDHFGISVSIHGDYAIVGAAGKDSWKGAAYIFKRDGDLWKEQQMLSADDGKKEDYFGYSVDISDDFAFVSAPWDDDKDEDTGSVYIFRRAGESWTQQAKLNPHGEHIKWCHFGQSIAISGDYLVVGSPQEESAGGAIYIFKSDGHTWKEKDKLKSSDWARFDGFGWSVSISGDYVIATAPYHNNHIGSAYIFKRIGDTWKEQAILTAKDVKAGDWFGASASISGNYAIVSSVASKDVGPGAAYIFVRTGTSWKQQAKIVSHDLVVGDHFGYGVYISGSGDHAMVAAELSEGKGAIYGFIREGDLWRQVSKLVASDAEKGDYFGVAADFSGDYAFVCAYKADVNGVDSGVVYIYNYAEFFPVEPSGSAVTTFGGEKDKPALPDTLIPPPARQAVPGEFRLLQNFPNPFNPETWLPYELASDASVMILIHNSNGELVRRLDLERQEAGFYTTRGKAAYWDGRNEAGEYVVSGVYFYTIQAGDFTARRKMTIAE